MSKKSKPTSARDARLAQARQEQQSKERRRTFLLVGSTALVIVAILAMVGYAIVSESEEREAAGNLEAVKEYEYEGGRHVQGQIDYQESPPVGGESTAASTRSRCRASTPSTRSSTAPCG